MTHFFQDVRYGVRHLRGHKGFTLVAVITLALGIGATSAMYSVLYATLIEPLPYPHPDRLVMVWLKRDPSRHGWVPTWVSSGEFLEWRRQNTVFEDLNATTAMTFNLATSGKPQQVRAQVATPSHYTMMGLPFLFGRNFLPEEGTPGKEHVVLLTYQLWQRLGADRAIIGKELRMNGQPYTVLGVFAPGPLDRIQFDLVVPLAFSPAEQSDFRVQRGVFVMGRLKPGVTLAQAQAEMELISRRIAHEHPDKNKGLAVSVEPLQNDFLPDSTRTTLWLLLGGVGFVLLIACANVANLLLAKSTVRQREVAVRISLGASRRRIFNQFLTESVILSLMGAVAGIGFSAVIVRAVVALIPDYTLPSEADVRISVPVLLFAIVVAVVTGVLFGCAPAWQNSSIDPNKTLKESGSVGSGVAHKRLRQALVVAEFGLALTLLAGAGLVIRSFWKLTHVDLGIRTDHILTFQLPVLETRFKDSKQVAEFYRVLLAHIQALPTVTTAEVSTGLPVGDPGCCLPVDIAGVTESTQNQPRRSALEAVTPQYFNTFGIPITKGRGFTEQDGMTSLRVALVSETFVNRYLANLDPLKQRIVTPDLTVRPLDLNSRVDWQIVGVFRDVRSFGPHEEPVPAFVIPFWQLPRPQTYVAVRTSADPQSVTKSIAAVVDSSDPDLPIAQVKTMQAVVNDRLANDRFSTLLYGAFAVLALLLAAVGIYGVMAFAVAQRTHEIGLRMALGAAPTQVLGLVLREGAILAGLGVLFGLAGAYMLGLALRSMLYDVAPLDLGVLFTVAMTLLAAALIASYFPASRAAKVTPMQALRYQ